MTGPPHRRAKGAGAGCVQEGRSSVHGKSSLLRSRAVGPAVTVIRCGPSMGRGGGEGAADHVGVCGPGRRADGREGLAERPQDSRGKVSGARDGGSR